MNIEEEVWRNQAKQYPLKGQGIEYFRGVIDNTGRWIDCLLYYGNDNSLEGLLNYFPFDYPPYEEVGNIYIHVRNDKRRSGIATILLNKAMVRYSIDLSRQKYTPLGKMFIKNYKS